MRAIAFYNSNIVYNSQVKNPADIQKKPISVIDMQGKVTEFHKISPHSWIYIEATHNGQKRTLALESGGPREQDIKVGDTIMAPPKDF